MFFTCDSIGLLLYLNELNKHLGFKLVNVYFSMDIMSWQTFKNLIMKFKILIILLVLIGCKESENSNNIQSDTNKHEEMMKSINKFHKSYELAIKENRLDDMDKLYTDDAKVIPAGGEEWNKLLNLAVKRGVSVAYDSLFISIEQTEILNDSMAYDWGTSKIYYTDDNNESQEVEDSFFALLKRRNNEWKIYRELSSSVVY
jgi:ketosteroid isomerase-like protein